MRSRKKVDPPTSQRVGLPVMPNEDKVNILVVDDLPEKLLVIETILQGLGQNVVKARSGREALRCLLDREFAVILLDVHMPDMDGLETAAMIRSRKQSADTPIIFITAFADESHTAQGYSLGAVDYIFSPVIPEILKTKVGVFVDLYKKTQQLKRQVEERITHARDQIARAAAEEATKRSSYLAEASSALTRSLDYDETLQGLARVLVPFLGDFGAVKVLDDSEGVRKLLVASINPAVKGCQQASISRSDLDPNLVESIDRVLESGRPILKPDPQALHSGRLDIPIGSGRGPLTGTIPNVARSMMIVPLEARGQVLGALILATHLNDRQLGPNDLSLAQDLAERAAIAIDNARLYRDIQENDRRKNEFLAMLAHELRNPLAPIRNSVKILEKLGLTHGEVGWASDIISRQVAQMVRLVDDLLDISRITGGKVQLQKEPVDVADVVTHAVETSRPLIEFKNQAFTVEIPGESVWVEADRARLSQVLSNLLNNAAKYTGEGGKILLKVEVDGRDVVFRVRDSGIGIPSEMISKVFDLFVQVDRSLDRSQGGLGLGLTLVRRLMELHGGSVSVQSDGPDLGSEFALRMPVMDRVEGLKRDLDHPESPEQSASYRILVVDDNVDSARSLSRLLRLSGHAVSTVHDGPGALEQFEKNDLEFVFLDIGLPGMDGYEVARQIRDRYPGGRAVLVALTGYGREEDRMRSQEVGFDHHLVKPVEFEKLLSIFQGSGKVAGNGLSRKVCDDRQLSSSAPDRD
jgi:signal transduction histidine kinase/DNA-binding response OmpR family regulator